MLLHKSAGGRAVLSSSVISRRFKHVLSDLPHDYRALETKDVRAAVTLQGALKFNGGGHINHSIFWTNLCKDGGEPSGELLEQIKRDFGTLESLQEKLSAASTAVQGSGWGWLGYNKADKRLQIATCANQEPLEPTTGLCLLFGIDVWEYAYYLQYKNMRPDYVKAIWKIANWKNVDERYHLSVNSRRFKHVLPDFPYDYGALEPVISAEIMRLHHQKHHATLQKGDVRAAVTLQRGLKINRDFKSVRCFSSDGDKQDPPSISSKREPDSDSIRMKTEDMIRQETKVQRKLMENHKALIDKDLDKLLSDTNSKIENHKALIDKDSANLRSETNIKFGILMTVLVGLAASLGGKFLYEWSPKPPSIPVQEQPSAPSPQPKVMSMQSGDLTGGFPYGTYEVKVGDSFASQKSSKPGNVNEFHTLPYDFKPKSVAGEQETYVGMADNNEVQVVVPSENSSTVYKGSKKVLQGDKECVLDSDRDSGKESKAVDLPKK